MPEKLSAEKLARYRLAELTDAQRMEVLGACVSASLAFVDAKGYPRIVPCWFLWDGEAFVVTSERDKFHVRCLRANPRASVCVELAFETPTERGNWQVKGVGEVDILDDGEGGWGEAIRRKYLGDGPAPPWPRDRVALRLLPNSLTAHGGGMKIDPQAAGSASRQ